MTEMCAPNLWRGLFVDSVNDALEAAGLPRTYTRKQAVTGIRVVFTKA